MPVFYLLIIPIINLVNDFSPDLLSLISRIFGHSENEQYVIKSTARFREFLTRVFSIDLPERKISRLSSLPSELETLINLVEERTFGNSSNDDTRRRRIVVMLFIVMHRDLLELDTRVDLFAYLKSCFRGLTEKGKEDFFSAYYQLVMHQKSFLSPLQYFTPIRSNVLESARHHFYDGFLKDDYIEEITKKLNFNESQIRTFKNSLKSIANSDKFNLSFLKRFVNQQSVYRKLFVIASDKNLPRPIQLYITSCPHFILNYSSIANLPVIGLSKRFDIFFFSPDQIISSPSALLEEFRNIDNSIVDHPLKIYEIDPFVSTSTKLPSFSHFSEAVSYFENKSMDTSRLENLSYDQIMNLLETNKISLRDLLQRLPLGELSLSALSTEKTFIAGISSEVVKTGNDLDVFSLLVKGKRVKLDSKISRIKNIEVDYTNTEIANLFSGNMTITKFRNRIKTLIKESITHLVALNSILQ